MIDYDLPEWVIDYNNDQIIVNLTMHNNFDKSIEAIITIDDVLYYYKHDACNFTSGMRSLAGYSGDWRQIDTMANFCLQYFKKVNINVLRIKAIEYGLKLKC